MRRILLLGAALMLATPLMVSQSTAAGTMVPQMKAAQAATVAGSLVEKAGWRHRRHCRRWSARCHWRHGWGRRYHRCMRRHGCRR